MIDHRDLHPAPWRIDTHSTRGGIVHAIVDSLARRVMVADSAADAERIVESVNMACCDEAHALEVARWQEAANAWRTDLNTTRERLVAENCQLSQTIDSLRARLRKLEGDHEA